MDNNTKNRTFRFTIIFIMTCMILLSSGLVFLFSSWTGKDSVSYLTEKLMSQILSHTLDKSLNFFDVASVNSKLSQRLAYSGMLNTEDFEEVVSYSKEVLKFYPHFESIYFGDILGNMVMIKKMEDQTLSVKFILRKRKRTAKTYWFHQNEKFKAEFPDLVEDDDKAYDPRKRAWYKKASEAGKQVWTDAYIFFTDRKPGITSATPIYDKDGVFKGVMSVDIGLADLSYFLSTLKMHPEDRIFLLNEKNEIVALPAQNASDIDKLIFKYKEDNEDKMRLYTIDESLDPIFKLSYNFNQKKKEKGSYITFPHNNEQYIALFTTFPSSSDLKWRIGIVMPERNFMEKIYFNNRLTLAFCIAFVIIALFVGIFFSKRVSYPLALLATEMDKIKEFELDSGNKIVSNLAEVNNISSSFERMRTAIKSFMKYVPAELVKDLVHMQKEAVLGGERKNLTIFFSDIAGFTSISEKLSPEALVDCLEEYLSVMSDEILDTGGTVDKYIGDAVMAFWGAPRDYQDHAIRACTSALNAQKRIALLTEKWAAEGKPEFYTRIGICSGDVIVGNMGSNKRINYTVIGDKVNLASRLESLNKVYGTRVIVSESTYELAKSHFEFCLVDKVAVKGKHEAVAIYELIEEKGRLPLEKLEFIKIFEDAFKLYQEQKFESALDLFKYLEREEPEKEYIRVFIQRCESYSEHPPSEDWNGVFIAKSK